MEAMVSLDEFCALCDKTTPYSQKELMQVASFLLFHWLTNCRTFLPQRRVLYNG